ncbi:hypothetical protein [Klebsiella pneumoniae IS22]|nr:hypothetical protein [Klebsiella pneumoniae IS22]
MALRSCSMSRSPVSRRLARREKFVNQLIGEGCFAINAGF